MAKAYVRYVGHESEDLSIMELTGAMGEIKMFACREDANNFIDDHAVMSGCAWALCDHNGNVLEEEEEE